MDIALKESALFFHEYSPFISLLTLFLTDSYQLPAPPENWVCFAQLARPGHAGPCPFLSRPGELALFRTIGPWERRSPDRHRRGNWVCFARSALRGLGVPPDFRFPIELALFRTEGLGLEYWNDGIVEWWGIPPIGNWVCFAHLPLETPSNT